MDDGPCRPGVRDPVQGVTINVLETERTNYLGSLLSLLVLLSRYKSQVSIVSLWKNKFHDKDSSPVEQPADQPLPPLREKKVELLKKLDYQNQMEGQFSPQHTEDSSPLEYDTDSSSSLDHEAVRKGREARLKYQIREKICKSAEDSMGNGLLEKHINNLTYDQSIACESVVEQVRGSAAWSSFIEKFITDNSQAAPHFLGETSNVLSGSPGAYDKLGSGKSIEKHPQKNFIELIKSFTALPAIKHALSKSHYARCMISSGAIPMGTLHISGASINKGKIRPDVCIVAFTEIKIGNEQDNKGQNIIRYQSACPGVLPAEYLNGNGRSSLAKQPEISSNGVEAELVACTKTAPTAFWENVLGTCSVKKNCGEAAKAENIGECALWASEILRHQWNRQFVNVCFLWDDASILAVRSLRMLRQRRNRY